MTAGPRVSLPVAVVTARSTFAGKSWRVPSWRIVGVVAGTNLPGRETRALPVHSDDREEHFLWGGLRLELYRDAAESYWVNLTGKQPSLFVLCTEDEAGRLVPRLVTADQNEACSGIEGDDRVFAAAIPPEVYQQIEAFVIAHHVPQEKRKRKRSDWSTGEAS
jgi:hypothetical protein